MEELERWLAAGEAVREALSKAFDMVKEGVSLLELAERLEAEVARRGAQPAFPANISINEVAAHYSPGVEDRTVVPEKGVVKVDLGAHVDGCIADAAVTIALDRRYEPLVDTAMQALRAALSALKPSIDLCEIGYVVESTVRARGLRPISNLSGHSMQRYVLHAGKHVPNVRSDPCGKASIGEIYAIEPFVTDGAGFVVEEERGTIYRLVSNKSLGDPWLDQQLRRLWSRYRNLPFSERWVYAEEGQQGLKGLVRLIEQRRVYRYPVLVEARRGMVSQFEDTVIVQHGRNINTTRVLELVRA